MRVGAPTATPTTTLCPPARLQQQEPHRAALVLILGFMGVEVVGGILSGTLAPLADAGHMHTGAASIALALLAMHVGNRAATDPCESIGEEPPHSTHLTPWARGGYHLRASPLTFASRCYVRKGGNK